MPDMSDTDNTYAMAPCTARPTAFGDLRFAGTIAAGLVAGTLGLGALAAPLVGWKDWPAGLTQTVASADVRLAKPAASNTGNAAADAQRARVGPQSATALTSVGSASVAVAVAVAAARRPPMAAPSSRSASAARLRPTAARVPRAPAPALQRHDFDDRDDGDAQFGTGPLP